MSALANDVQFSIDASPQQGSVEVDALARRGHLIITGVHNEERTDARRSRLRSDATFQDLTDVVRNSWVEQTSEIGHSADFGFRRFRFGVQRTADREVAAGRKPGDANLIGLQAQVLRLLPQSANGLPAIGSHSTLVVLPCVGWLEVGRTSAILQNEGSHVVIFQPDRQVVTFAVNPDIPKATSRANHQAHAIRFSRAMDTVRGGRDRTECTIQSGWRSRSWRGGANLLFDIMSNRLVRRSLLPQRQFRRQVNCLQTGPFCGRWGRRIGCHGADAT